MIILIKNVIQLMLLVVNLELNPIQMVIHTKMVIIFFIGVHDYVTGKENCY